MKVLFSNKKIYLNYFVIEEYEAGISLKGTEVKSIVKANANIDDAFVLIKNQEAYVMNMYVAPFKEGNIHNVEPTRTRKLLLNKNEIIKLEYLLKKDRLTIIPALVYLKNNVIKMKIALSKSKKLHDKRDDLKKRDASREVKKYI